MKFKSLVELALWGWKVTMQKHKLLIKLLNWNIYLSIAAKALKNSACIILYIKKESTFTLNINIRFVKCHGTVVTTIVYFFFSL